MHKYKSASDHQEINPEPQVEIDFLTFTTLWANPADNKIRFDISCKLSP